MWPSGARGLRHSPCREIHSGRTRPRRKRSSGSEISDANSRPSVEGKTTGWELTAGVAGFSVTARQLLGISEIHDFQLRNRQPLQGWGRIRVGFLGPHLKPHPNLPQNGEMERELLNKSDTVVQPLRGRAQASGDPHDGLIKTDLNQCHNWPSALPGGLLVARGEYGLRLQGRAFQSLSSPSAPNPEPRGPPLRPLWGVGGSARTA